MLPGIVVFGFGFPTDIVANQLLTEMAKWEMSLDSTPVFTQREIVLDGAEYSDAPGPQGPMTTLRVCRAAVQWAHLRGLDEIMIIAAKPHLWRCLRDMRYAAREVNFDIKVYASDLIENVSSKQWFRGDSEQWCTKSRVVWYLRDSILRIMPMSIYRRIAS